jgi:hypothetical protein
MSEHIFEIRLFWAATAIAVLGVAVTQAGWKHKAFVNSLFGVAGLSFFAAIFWPQIAPYIPESIDVPLGTLSSNLISWLVLLAVAVSAICFLDYRARLSWAKHFPTIEALLEGENIVVSPTPLVLPEPHSGPNVAKWFPPLKSLDEFVDKALLNAAVQALNNAKAAKEARDAEFKDKSPYEVIRIDATNEFSKKAQDTEIAFMVARQRLFDSLISQMKEGVLVGRALPFDDKKLEDRDWEIIKSSHWSVLRFETTDQTYETVSGGGRTYKGLQIGKPQ